MTNIEQKGSVASCDATALGRVDRANMPDANERREAARLASMARCNVDGNMSITVKDAKGKPLTRTMSAIEFMFYLQGFNAS
jgi:hypothetical protein